MLEATHLFFVTVCRRSPSLARRHSKKKFPRYRSNAWQYRLFIEFSTSSSRKYFFIRYPQRFFPFGVLLYRHYVSSSIKLSKSDLSICNNPIRTTKSSRYFLPSSRKQNPRRDAAKSYFSALQFSPFPTKMFIPIGKYEFRFSLSLSAS